MLNITMLTSFGIFGISSLSKILLSICGKNEFLSALNANQDLSLKI
jgi:hypothetical protein